MATVAALIDMLSTFPKDALVIMASDAEGNSFSPLHGPSKGHYLAETTWRGEFATNKRELGKGSVPAVVLWPTN